MSATRHATSQGGACPRGNHTKSLARFLVAGALLAQAQAARADDSQPKVSPPPPPAADTAATAQALFVEARHLVTDGRTAEGCTKFEQSYKLDAAPGTQINLADCYEKLGKLASAWLAFHDASASAQRAGRAEWAEQARQRARILEPTVPRLSLIVDDPTPGLSVLKDGGEVDPMTLGSPVPVDPGTYEIAATAAGRRPWSTRVVVEASTRVVLHVPLLADEPQAAQPAVGRVLHQPAETIVRRGALRRTLGVSLAAASVIPFAIGSYAGVFAIYRNGQAAALCKGQSCTEPQPVAWTNEARDDAHIADVAFAVGGALLVAGAVLYLTAPRDNNPPTVAFGVSGRELSLLGRW